MGLISVIFDLLEEKLFPDNPRFSLPRDSRYSDRIVNENNYKNVRMNDAEKLSEEILTIPCYKCGGTREDKNDYNPATGEYYPCKECHGTGKMPVDEDGRLK